MCIQTYIHKHALLRGIKNEVTKIKDQVAIHKMHTACSKLVMPVMQARNE